MNRKLYEDRYIIPDCLSTCTYNLYALSQSKHKGLKPVDSKSIEVVELIHTDVGGPFRNESHSGSKYLLTMIDDFSHSSWVVCRNQKSNTSITIRTFFQHLERQFSKIIKRMRYDNGGNYISNELKDCFLTSSVVHEFTPPYSPESNGIAERFNQTVKSIMHSMTLATLDFHACGLKLLTWLPI
jgi:transposase InsO family protein